MSCLQDGQMDHNIDRLRFAAMEVLLRLSKRFARRRLGTIFLITNFHHIVQVPAHSLLSPLSYLPALKSDIPGLLNIR